jgi:hypothetical protein
VRGDALTDRPVGFADYFAISLANDGRATELLTFDGKLLGEAGNPRTGGLSSMCAAGLALSIR